MPVKRPTLKLVPLGEINQFQDLLYSEESSLTLRELLLQAPALSTEPIDEALMDRQLSQMIITPLETPWDRPLYRPPGLRVKPMMQSLVAETDAAPLVPDSEPAADSRNAETELAVVDFPQDVSEAMAVRLAYAREIESAASFLRAGLSVLVLSDKLVVQHLWKDMAQQAALSPVPLQVPEEEDLGLMPRGLRQRQMAALKQLIKDLKKGDVLVLPHLDLLAGGTDANLPTESRELIELVYEKSDRLILAFADRSATIPEVLAARFAVRLLVTGVSRMVVYPGGQEQLLGNALITADEVKRFQDYDPEGLYKNVSGMNPVRIRHALQYATEQATAEQVPVAQLYQAIRSFKVQTSNNFEVPDVTFNDIGGYEQVKNELSQAIRLMTGAYNLPNEKLRRELIPKGFIFHGPPGTGKTLFAKAIANQLNATIQVVSGPEVTDMYVGESERKVRELFAEARRNAPAVLVFDEFDSIASRRSGREDGGSRAGNALVAQMLTEMDGFRPDVPMLVIGTTNRLDIIDEALLRPSRFKPVAIGLPNVGERRAIARVQAKHFGIEVSTDLLEVIATSTEGMNGDELKSLFRDVCVGLHCEEPPLPINAYRFGLLIGKLRQLSEQRSTQTTGNRFSSITGGQTPRPRSPMIMLTVPSEAIVLEDSVVVQVDDDNVNLNEPSV
jgi:transitional endoplasmic reticulum ATPase